MIAIRAIQTLSLLLVSALILQIHAENKVKGYVFPWKILLTIDSVRFGVILFLHFPSLLWRVTAANILLSK